MDARNDFFFFCLREQLLATIRDCSRSLTLSLSTNHHLDNHPLFFYLWLVMEWCQKGVLTEVSLSDKPSKIFEDAECRDVFRQMVLGIEYRKFPPLGAAVLSMQC